MERTRGGSVRRVGTHRDDLAAIPVLEMVLLHADGDTNKAKGRNGSRGAYWPFEASPWRINGELEREEGAHHPATGRDQLDRARGNTIPPIPGSQALARGRSPESQPAKPEERRA